MNIFTKEELQFIKEHLNYPIDRDKTSIYYQLIEKLKKLIQK